MLEGEGRISGSEKQRQGRCPNSHPGPDYTVPQPLVPRAGGPKDAALSLCFPCGVGATVPLS
jgi:hypothetical protein